VKDTVRHATKVEVQLLDVPYKEGVDLKTIEHDWFKWKTKGQPVVLDAATAKQLADTLLDETAYYRGPPKACKPMPGVKTTFIRDKEVATILYCLECSTVFVQGGGGDDYDPRKSAIVAVMKKAFPNEAAIQAFK
jgi:hypothetical protein